METHYKNQWSGAEAIYVQIENKMQILNSGLK